MKAKLLKITLLALVALVPRVSFADSCTTGALSTVLGTTCTIGDVSYTFLNAGPFVYSSSAEVNGMPTAGIPASDLTFVPNASNPLDPSFSITGASASAVGVGNWLEEAFQFFWTATVTASGFEIGTATNSIVDFSLPSAPSYGDATGGNNLGTPTFTTAIVQTGGPNTNPDSTSIDLTSITTSNGPDGLFASLFAQDGTGNGALTSVGFEYQYNLAPVPEPSSMMLLGAALLALAGLRSKRRTA
ncbi:MAG TPA: PEP-CTERM sorting domain-containing protein [Candidatus Cybelea sp.]|nr:PEP-CTERM sorting domain-containing protein [Candidatus Cybelea sp.]